MHVNLQNSSENKWRALHCAARLNIYKLIRLMIMIYISIPPAHSLHTNNSRMKREVISPDFIIIFCDMIFRFNVCICMYNCITVALFIIIGKKDFYGERTHMSRLPLTMFNVIAYFLPSLERLMKKLKLHIWSISGESDAIFFLSVSRERENFIAKKVIQITRRRKQFFKQRDIEMTH